MKIEENKIYVLNNGEITEPLVKLKNFPLKFASITSSGRERRWYEDGVSTSTPVHDTHLDIKEEYIETMKLEKNKRYVLNNGEITEPLVQISICDPPRFSALLKSTRVETRWDEDGKNVSPANTHGQYDIASEMIAEKDRCKCGGKIISRVCSCGEAHPSFKIPKKRRAKVLAQLIDEHGMHTEPLDGASIIKQRSKYGNYATNSQSVQEVKEVFRSHPNWYNLPPEQRESLEMIVHKIGRIIGGHNEPTSDSWLDIQGYVELIRNPPKS